MRIQRLAKQVLDRILAFVLLVLLTPLLAVVVGWILVDCGRPVFFVYPRAGRFGRPFPMLKFRTMIPDAIEVGRTQKLSEDPFGLVHEDPRITRSGRFLRRTSLDELPQLLNVVRGEMSLVGPRPDLVEAGFALQRARPPTARRPSRHHRLVSDPRARRDRMAGANRAGPLVHRPLVALARSADPGGDCAAALPRGADPDRGRREHRAGEAGSRAAVTASHASTTIVEVEPGRWDDLLAKIGCTDAYFRRAYIESALVLEPGAAAYLHVEGGLGDVVLPCIVRTLPEQLEGAEGLLDVITPYGYGGPVATGDDPPLEHFWRSTETGARSGAWLRASCVSTRCSRIIATPGPASPSTARHHDCMAPRAGDRSVRRHALRPQKQRAESAAGRRRGVDRRMPH